LIKRLPLSLFFFGLLLNANSTHAESWRYQTRGYLSARLSGYTQDGPKNYGQETRAQFEQTTEFNSNLSALNQLRWMSNSLNSDLTASGNLSKNDTFETYLGENYLKYKGDSWVAQLGYQEVVWGEAFGFNYADIISPKDQRETLYSDAGDARLPLLLFNGKRFFSVGNFSGSFQVLYSPEPRFSKTLPIEIYAGNVLSNYTVTVNKEKTPKVFDNSEYGGKFSGSYSGFDFSLYTFSYLDRDAHYEFRSASSLTNITVDEAHNKVQSSGFSFAKTVYDYVFRADIVSTKDKEINYLDITGLKSFSTRMLNTLVSVDSPTYSGYSGVLIFARSSLGDIMENSFREKNEEYGIIKLNKDLGSDKSFEFSYTHEFEHAGHSVQTFINWPINSTTDLKLGGQFYFGDETSNLFKYKKISSVFFSLKNYFQL
jgi:hypothetical protein